MCAMHVECNNRIIMHLGGTVTRILNSLTGPGLALLALVAS